MEDKGEIDEYNVSQNARQKMLSALLLCMPGHFPSAKKWRKLQMHDRSAEDLMNNYISWQV